MRGGISLDVNEVPTNHKLLSFQDAIRETLMHPKQNQWRFLGTGNLWCTGMLSSNWQFITKIVEVPVVIDENTRHLHPFIQQVFGGPWVILRFAVKLVGQIPNNPQEVQRPNFAHW